MSYKNEQGCQCAKCNSGIEERQYAHWELPMPDETKVMVLVDVEEYAHFAALFEGRLQPEDIERRDEPEEKAVLAYGVLIPQASSNLKYRGIKVTDWKELVEGYVGYAFSTLYEQEEYLSCYEDVECYPEDEIYGNIPIACLLKTTLTFPRNDYEFAYTLFLRKKTEDNGMTDIFDNIFSREFVLAIKEIQDVEDTKEWKQKIDRERLRQIAKRII